MNQRQVKANRKLRDQLLVIHRWSAFIYNLFLEICLCKLYYTLSNIGRVRSLVAVKAVFSLLISAHWASALIVSRGLLMPLGRLARIFPPPLPLTLLPLIKLYFTIQHFLPQRLKCMQSWWQKKCESEFAQSCKKRYKWLKTWFLFHEKFTIQGILYDRAFELHNFSYFSFYIFYFRFRTSFQ